MTVKQIERQKAIERLQTLLSPGDTVYTICTHVSQSGMMRYITCLIPSKIKVKDKDAPTILNISYLVAKVLEWKMAPEGNRIKVQGCGMDMGFHTVYELSSAIFKDKTKKADAGYALRQEWI